MTGKQLFERKSVRDFTGSTDDEYAQFLATVFFNIGDKLYPLLEEAEKEGKTLSLKDVEKDEIIASDLIMV